MRSLPMNNLSDLYYVPRVVPRNLCLPMNSLNQPERVPINRYPEFVFGHENDESSRFITKQFRKESRESVRKTILKLDYFSPFSS